LSRVKDSYDFAREEDVSTKAGERGLSGGFKVLEDIILNLQHVLNIDLQPCRLILLDVEFGCYDSGQSAFIGIHWCASVVSAYLESVLECGVEGCSDCLSAELLKGS
jgi:hypothetical protein